jgi:hypothetical protein
MKRFAILLAATAFASCSSEPAPEPTPEATEAVAAAPTTADMAGTYEYTMPDGTKGSSVMTPEGTYTDTEGDKVETGAWAVTDGKTCFDPAGDDPTQPNRCYATTEPDANGVFTATRDGDGAVLTIKKVG